MRFIFFSTNIPYIFPHTCIIFLRLLCTESRCSDGQYHTLSGLSHDLLRLPMNSLIRGTIEKVLYVHALPFLVILVHFTL